MATNRDPIEALTETWEPRLREAFLSAVRRIADRVSVAAVAEALARGDVEAAVRLVGLDANDFTALRNAMHDAFAAGGSSVAETIPAIRDGAGALIKILFDVRNLRAENWIAERSSSLVTEIVADQLVMIRANLRAGLEAGLNPRTTALDLVGRISPATKTRVGGVIGLTSGQEAWQRAYAAEIASSDPAALRKALDRGLRDKRFDRSVEKAIASGEPIPVQIQAKMLAAYRNRSLKYRADTIARNETIRALGRSQTEAFSQAIDSGQVEAEAITRFWRTAGDERVRHTHRLIPGMNAKGVGWGEPFQTPTGPSMHAPHDVDIMCRCREVIRINTFRGLT